MTRQCVPRRCTGHFWQSRRTPRRPGSPRPISRRLRTSWRKGGPTKTPVCGCAPRPPRPPRRTAAHRVAPPGATRAGQQAVREKAPSRRKPSCSSARSSTGCSATSLTSEARRRSGGCSQDEAQESRQAGDPANTRPRRRVGVDDRNQEEFFLAVREGMSTGVHPPDARRPSQSPRHAPWTRPG